MEIYLKVCDMKGIQFLLEVTNFVGRSHDVIFFIYNLNFIEKVLSDCI